MIPAARSVFFPPRPRSPGAQRDLETRFFRALRLPNGTYKTTFPGRLTDVDAATADLLGGHGSLTLLDVAVSSGTTTVELLATLEARGLRVRATATDLYLRAALERRAGCFDVLLDPTGYALQVSCPVGTKCRPHDPAGSWRRRWLDRLLGVLGGVPGPGALPVLLVARTLRDRPDVVLEQQDLSMPRVEWHERFDLVRAANILNLDYFAPNLLRQMAGHLSDCVRPGGLLVVCRTLDDASNHATIFRKTSAGLAPVARVGHGSEIESLMTARPEFAA